MPNSRGYIDLEFGCMILFVMLAFGFIFIISSCEEDRKSKLDIAAMENGYVQDKEGRWVKEK